MTDTNGRSMTELVETTDEEGVTHYFEKIEEFECDAKPYALLIYRGTSDEDGEVDEEGGFDEEYVVMRVVQEGDGELAYEYIDDEDEFKKAIAHLEALDYDFDTDDDDEDDDDADDESNAADEDFGDEDKSDVLVIKNDPSLN